METIIKTSIEIEAPAALVWRILLDFQAYKSWNPFIVRAWGQDGHFVMLSRVFHVVLLPVRARILSLTPNAYLYWAGGLKGLLYGEHGHRIVDLGGGRVRFEHEEHFNGLLTLFLKGWMLHQLTSSYEQLNAAIKLRAEQASVQAAP